MGKILVMKLLFVRFKESNMKFDRVVSTIEESKDMSTYSFDELMSSLLAHEARLSRCHENVEEKAFRLKGEPSNMRKIENTAG